MAQPIDAPPLVENGQFPKLRPVDHPLSLVPVGLKEAALDSPTFRATAAHLAEQVDHVEKWLDGYARAGTRISHDVLQLEASISSWLQQTTPPSQVTEAILDHDYALLAARRYADAAREFWQASFRSIKRSEKNVLEPIRAFFASDLRQFKEARRSMDAAQRVFDSVLARYASQPKTKESSALREDAFQLHEARKAYLRASMDFCVQGPTLRASLDKLIVRMFSDQWDDARNARETYLTAFARWSTDMNRIKGWSREIENSERAFKRELQLARRQIEDSVEHAVRPPRELDDYVERTGPFVTSTKGSNQRPERQGWLFLKQTTGKPTRTLWTRRWFFVKGGIFGWLVQTQKSGGVEESEKIGILLCSIRQAPQEERRFCFELKTKDTGIVLQAESQSELDQWIDAFELAKRKALEDPAATEDPARATSTDVAFAINPPVAPEFAAKADLHLTSSTDESNGLGISDPTSNQFMTRSSFDVSSQRRPGSEKDPDTPRIIQKFDLHRKATPSSQLNPSGGIASLISSSHNILPVGPAPAPINTMNSTLSTPIIEARSAAKSPLMGTHAITSLAPATLANPPAPTSLSKTAVVVSSERDVNIGQADGSAMPGGITANMWGTEKWGTVNRLERDGIATPKRVRSLANSPELTRGISKTADDLGIMDGQHGNQKTFADKAVPFSTPGAPIRQTTLSRPTVEADSATPWDDGYPKEYPLALRAQDAQFRVLFPEVSRAEKVVLVFRATWNPNEEQEFPGRVFITTREIYFYSHHLGFVLISGVSMETITEVTAAPGRECDFLFVHIKDGSRPDDLRRVTIKTFLEPLKMLQKRVNFLVQNANAEEPASLQEVIKTLLRLENVEPGSPGSWEDLGLSPDEDDLPKLPQRREYDIKPSLRIDGKLHGDIAKTGRDVTRFKLPSQAVIYIPPGVGSAALTKDFGGSAKALFHVMFGDKSALFQQLYRNRGAKEISQSAWSHADEAHSRRTLASEFGFGTLTDTQTIDVQNDHLCYVVTSTRVPVNYPMADKFFVMVKYVITHLAKSQSRLGIYHKIVWTKDSPLRRGQQLIERRVKIHLDYDAHDIVNLSMDQMARLGAHGSTAKAINIFGHVGQATQPVHISCSDLPTTIGRTRNIKKHTLLSLYWQEVFRGILKVVSMGFDLADALAKSLMSVFTAHTILVLLLMASAMFNSWYSYRANAGWWHDRRAAKYMARLGVKSDATISRTLYIGDYEQLINSTTQYDMASVIVSSQPPTSCKATFGQQLQQHRGSDEVARPMIRRSSRRLQGTRKVLAEYRHDLLVAMRVVNQVEKEVVKTAWEDWLHEESGRCRRMKKVLERQRDEANDSAPEALAELQSYCDGCQADLKALSRQ